MEKSMREEWRPVRGFESYAEISNYGQIHRFRREWYCGENHKSKRIQEEEFTYGNDNGYGYLYACIGGVHKGVHVWVYLTFVGDITEGLQVNHIDEDKHNNRLDNLNLKTPKDNCNWGTRNKRSADALRGRKRPYVAAAKRGKYNTKCSKAVQALDKNGNVVMEFPSAAEAERQYGFSQGNISQCCNGKLKSYKGYIWRFKE